MTPGAPAEAWYTAARFFALVDEGVLHPDDRVEPGERRLPLRVDEGSPPNASCS